VKLGDFSSKKKYEAGDVCPEGTYAAVFVDWIDKGTQTGSYQGGPVKTRRVLALRWLMSPKNTKGQHFMIEKWYTASDHIKSGLIQMLQMWRGRKFETDDERRKFDLDSLILFPAMITISHEKKEDGGTRASVVSVVPLPSGMACDIDTSNYQRVKDRKVE
jgi:hypothetical protein